MLKITHKWLLSTVQPVTKQTFNYLFHKEIGEETKKGYPSSKNEFKSYF